MSAGLWVIHQLMRKHLVVGVLLLWLLAGGTARAAGDICFTCQKQIRFTVYTWTDKVTRSKVWMCGDCAALPDNCYLCSVPVLKEFSTLPDGRVICKRDLASVVLDEREAGQICAQVKHDLDRLLIRFLTIPETNVTVQLMDRVKLQELYKVIGNDYACPNTLGCTETITNAGRRSFEISILSGQPREDLMTTCVHEYAHTWIIENVPAPRLKTIGKDAVEGFCELLSYLFAEEQGLTAGKANILANHYTRGQIHLFIAAHKQYGLQDIVDWMKFGEDPLLLQRDLSRIRRLTAPTVLAPTVKRSPATNHVRIKPAAQLPERLILQGIVWSRTQPIATINGRNFDVNQEATLQLRAGPVAVRCLAITTNSVVLSTNGASERLTLVLP